MGEVDDAHIEHAGREPAAADAADDLCHRCRVIQDMTGYIRGERYSVGAAEHRSARLDKCVRSRAKAGAP